ncbi:hypothetical protein CYMTET_50597, partial [Cymbomonas tetramitiformis]
LSAETCTNITAGRSSSREAASMGEIQVPYTHLWCSADGETHVQECFMSDFVLKGYSNAPQAVREDGVPTPDKIAFTQVPVGWDNPWHPCPKTQFVITLSGSWYVTTSDGSRREFTTGDVLFQDNTPDAPAAKIPQHYSGTVGDVPCQQMIIQVDRAPEVDNPGCL